MFVWALTLLIGASNTAVLLRGHIDAATPLPETNRPENEVAIGAPTRIRLRIKKVEAGRWTGTRTIEATIPMASMPASERTRNVLLLVEREGTGWKPIAWDTAASGLCIPDDYAAAHGLATAWPRLKARRIISCD